MEVEKYFSGYCRVMDAPRLVEVLLENRRLTEVDCCYGSCIHEGNCPIAGEIREMK